MKHEINIYDRQQTWDTFKVPTIHSPQGTEENKNITGIIAHSKIPKCKSNELFVTSWTT
jgi:hypothetical protein